MPSRRSSVNDVTLHTAAEMSQSFCKSSAAPITSRRIGPCPDQVADALETEDRVVDVEGEHGRAMRRVRRGCGEPRGKRAGLGDALLQDLAVLRLAVIQELVLVLGIVELSDRGVDAEL